jgi:3-keto-5-aminohexanoate cleavage enzyme
VIGPDIGGPAACIRRVRPEIAACNAGSLNYLKLKDDGQWAWPPMVFDNPVDKVQRFLAVMEECGVHPEFECFDVGIVRSVGMYLKAGLKPGMGRARVQLRDGRGLGHALRRRPAGAAAALSVRGRGVAEHADRPPEIWPVHQRTAELGGMLRSGLEDTFYLPDGSRAGGNGELIEALARCAARAGRAVASPAEARALLGLAP